MQTVLLGSDQGNQLIVSDQNGKYEVLSRKQRQQDIMASTGNM